MTITTPALCHPRILTGTIAAIDLVRYTATIRPSFDSKSLIHDVSLPATYINPMTGTGTYTVPEVGTQVVYLDLSEPRTRPIILCSFATPLGDGTGSRAANRAAATPGDTRIDAVGGAHLHVLRRGAVSLGASPACRVLLTTNPDRLDVLATDLSLLTPGAAVTSLVLPEGYDSEGKIATQTSWSVYRFVDDAEPSYRAEMGVLDDADLDGRWAHTDAAGAVLLELLSYQDGAVELTSTSTVDILPAGAAGAPEPVLLSGELLTDIADALTELSSAVVALGSPTPQTLAVIAKLRAAVASPASTRYSSQVLRSR